MGHVANAAVIGSNYFCGDCHATVVAAGTNSPVTGVANHVNGAKNVSIANRGSFVSTDTGTTCAATYCHSSGQATPVYRSITWAGAAIGCNGCHGLGNAAGAPDYTSGSAGSATANSHAAHTASGSNPATCQNCHSGLVTASGTAISGANHTNGARNVAILAAYDTNGATINYDPVTKTCSSVSCHGTSSIQWGAVVACNTCHGNTGAKARPPRGSPASC
jgi:predicted CxxxxCH...CXXCH cytochrome family protein